MDKNNEQVFAYTRTLNNKKVLIVANLTNQTATFKYDNSIIQDNILLHNYKNEAIDINAIKPFEAFVLST
ncbi:alpha-D-1%2C4-glucosidase [Staphylococcus aureus]|nr:alpha-D-1%2C4-glucosidase [Staphylococcus aureus]